MYCKKCGNMQKNGEKFCPKCGTPYLSETSNDLSDSGKVPVDNDTETKSNQTIEESPRQEFTDNKPNQGENEITKADDKPSEGINTLGSGIGIKIFAWILIGFALLMAYGTVYSIGFHLSWKWLLVAATAFMAFVLWRSIPKGGLTEDSKSFIKSLMWIVGGLSIFNIAVYNSDAVMIERTLTERCGSCFDEDIFTTKVLDVDVDKDGENTYKAKVKVKLKIRGKEFTDEVLEFNDINYDAEDGRVYYNWSNRDEVMMDVSDKVNKMDINDYK